MDVHPICRPSALHFDDIRKTCEYKPFRVVLPCAACSTHTHCWPALFVYRCRLWVQFAKVLAKSWALFSPNAWHTQIEALREMQTHARRIVLELSVRPRPRPLRPHFHTTKTFTKVLPKARTKGSTRSGLRDMVNGKWQSRIISVPVFFFGQVMRP